MPSHSPSRLPTTTSTRAPNSTLTPVTWPAGSLPPTAGARNKPPATYAVATQKMASCRCQVRARWLGSNPETSMP
jgi:hypothetical protein